MPDIFDRIKQKQEPKGDIFDRVAEKSQVATPVVAETVVPEPTPTPIQTEPSIGFESDQTPITSAALEDTPISAEEVAPVSAEPAQPKPIPQIKSAQVSPLERVFSFMRPKSRSAMEASKIADAQIRLEAKKAGFAKEDFIGKTNPDAIPLQRAERFLDGIGRGAVGTVGNIVGGAAWLADSDLALDLSNKVQVWDKERQPENPDFSDALASGFGSSAVFFIPGIGIAKGSAQLAKLSPRIASWIGTGIATSLESMAEAGGTYTEVLEATGSKEEASAAATTTFLANVPLIAVTNKFGIFAEKGGRLKRTLVSSVLESSQEAGQEVVGALAANRDISTKDMLTSAGVGFITGGIGGGVSVLALPGEQITPPVGPTVQAAEALETGIESEPSVETPENKSLSQEIIETLSQEEQDRLIAKSIINDQHLAEAQGQKKLDPRGTPEEESLRAQALVIEGKQRREAGVAPETKEAIVEKKKVEKPVEPIEKKEVAPTKPIEKKVEQPAKKEVVKPTRKKAFKQPKTEFKPTKETIEAGREEPSIISKIVKPEIVGKRKGLTTVRSLTNQIKVGELIDERKALRKTFRILSKESRKIFAEGKRVGIEKVIAQKKLKAEVDKITKSLKTRADKAINTINKIPTENIPVDYKTQLNNIKKGIDFKRRSRQTLIQQQKMRSFIEQQQAKGEAINIPKSILDMISRKPVSEMSLFELENLADTIKQVAHIGKTKGKLLKIRKGKQVNSVLTDLEGTLSKAKGVRTIPEGVPITEATKKKFRPGRIISGIRETLLDKNRRVERLLSRLDNFQGERLGEGEGANRQIIWNPINSAAKQSVKNQQDKIDLIINLVKANKVDLNKVISQPRKANDNVTVTGEEAMEIYSATFDQDKLLHAQSGNNLSDQDVIDIVNTLSKNERQFVESVIRDYYGPQYTEVNSVFRELYNNELPQIENYSPINIDKELSELTPYEDDLSKELLGRQTVRAAFIERGMTKMRKSGAQQPLNLKFFDNIFRNIEKVEHFKAFGLAARDVRQIINNPRYKKAVERSAGRGNYKILKNWFEDTISRRTYSESSASPIIRMLRQHTAVGMLGFNAVTSIKQPVSFFAGMALTSEHAMLSGIQQVARDPKAIEEFVYTRSPQQKNRSVERDIKELMKKVGFTKEGIKETLRGAAQFGGRKTLAEKSMTWVKFMDKKTVLSVWKGSYDFAINKGQTEGEAIHFADKVVERTQPAFEIKDLPAFFRGGEIEKILTMFQNQRNQNWNLFEHDVLGVAKAGKISKLEALRRSWWIWVMPAFVLGAIERGRFKRDTGEFAMDMMKYSPVAGTFLMGSILESVLSGFDWSLPVFQSIKEIGVTVKAKKTSKKLKHGLKAAGYISGVPVNQAIRTTTGASALLKGKTKDVRRLIMNPK